MEVTKTPQQLACERAIFALGGTGRAARLLKVKNNSHQTVQSWLKSRVPAEYCPAIERQTRELGKTVTCEELRPDIDWGYVRESGAAQDEAEEQQMDSSSTGFDALMELPQAVRTPPEMNTIAAVDERLEAFEAWKIANPSATLADARREWPDVFSLMAQLRQRG